MSPGASAGSGCFSAKAGCGRLRAGGAFAALTLAEKGFPSFCWSGAGLVRRGSADVRAFWEQGILNPESHVHFGDGRGGNLFRRAS